MGTSCSSDASTASAVNGGSASSSSKPSKAATRASKARWDGVDPLTTVRSTVNTITSTHHRINQDTIDTIPTKASVPHQSAHPTSSSSSSYTFQTARPTTHTSTATCTTTADLSAGSSSQAPAAGGSSGVSASSSSTSSSTTTTTSTAAGVSSSSSPSPSGVASPGTVPSTPGGLHRTDSGLPHPLPPTVFITNASSPISLSTIAALNKNFPHIRVRAGLLKHQKASDACFAGLTIDPITVDPNKRNIWACVGAQAVLIIPSADDRTQTSLRYVAAAKTAGCKLICVVSMPNKGKDPNAPNPVERYVLQTKVACCFVRLPFDSNSAEYKSLHGGSSPSGVPAKSESMMSASSANYISIEDIGSACATITANWKDHVFTRYELMPEAAPPAKPTSDQPQPSSSLTQDDTLPHNIHTAVTQPNTPIQPYHTLAAH